MSAWEYLDINECESGKVQISRSAHARKIAFAAANEVIRYRCHDLTDSEGDASSEVRTWKSD